MKKIKKEKKKRKIYTGKILTAVKMREELGKNEQTALSYRILEYREMQSIDQELAGQLANKFCYEFMQYDKQLEKEVPIRGIRAVGVREAIRFCNIKEYNFIPKFTYEAIDLGEGWHREIVSCLNPNTGEITRSTAQWHRGDRFSDRTATTIAERNAMLKHLPAEVQFRYIKYCIDKGYILKHNVDPTLPENKEALQALPSGQEINREKNEAGKTVQGTITQIYAIFGAFKIKSEAARIWMHKTYKVESLKDLTIERLESIVKGLKEIQYNTPEYTKKPKAGILTIEELREKVQAAGSGK